MPQPTGLVRGSSRRRSACPRRVAILALYLRGIAGAPGRAGPPTGARCRPLVARPRGRAVGRQPAACCSCTAARGPGAGAVATVLSSANNACLLILGVAPRLRPGAAPARQRLPALEPARARRLARGRAGHDRAVRRAGARRGPSPGSRTFALSSITLLALRVQGLVRSFRRRGFAPLAALAAVAVALQFAAQGSRRSSTWRRSARPTTSAGPSTWCPRRWCWSRSCSSR